MAGERDQAIERGKAKADDSAAQRTTDAKGGKGGKGKGKDGKKDKKDKKGAAGGASVAAHPRGAQAVRRAKGFGAIAGFAIAALLSHSAGLPATRTVERALLAGIGGYLIAWACAVTVWRHIVIAEMKAAFEIHAARQAELAPRMIGTAGSGGSADATTTAPPAANGAPGTTPASAQPAA